MTRPLVRPMRADELDDCADLYDRVVRDTFTWLDLSGTDQRAKFRAEAADEEIYVAEAEARILGLAAFYRPEDFLHSLYVEADAQGRGVGKHLLEHVDSLCRRPMSLKVQVLNLNARRFYAREGFWTMEEGGEPLPSNDRWLRLQRRPSLWGESPAPRLAIGPAKGDDLDLCAALYERVAARSAAWEPAEARTAASKRATFEGASVLTAKEHGVLAGFVAYRREEAFVDSVFAEPQGAGTGLALLKEAGYRIGRPFRLDCDTRNVAGLRFYERHGFSRTGVADQGTFQMFNLISDGRWV